MIWQLSRVALETRPEVSAVMPVCAEDMVTDGPGSVPSDRRAKPALSFDQPPTPIRRGSNWPMVLGPLLSLAVFVAALFQLRGIDFGKLKALLPCGPGFWLAFAVYYLAGPLVDFAIFRRLWRLPASGFPVLLGKLVSNEILLGYLGRSISTLGPSATQQ